MHKDFSDWYRIASIDLKDIDLNGRWAALEKFASDTTETDLLDAARLFFGLPVRADDFIDRLKVPFKLADEKFSMLDNNAELRVLAGAVLVAMFEISAGWGEAAALSLVCGSFGERRSAPVGDIVRLAKEFLAERSAALRVHTSSVLPMQFAEQANTTWVDLQKVLQANGTINTLAEPLQKLLHNVSASIQALLEWAKTQEQRQALRQEESDVLWWLFSAYSRDLNISFDRLAPPAIVFIAGKEMADLTRSIPGPYSARAFLDKAVRETLHDSKHGKVNLAEAVSSCPADWRKSVARLPGAASVEDLCLALFAIHKAVESDGKKAWESVFESVSGYKANEEFDPVDLAEQLYTECLFARAVSALKSA